jgi:uncharacterized protein involved in outer membrane biogenesis
MKTLFKLIKWVVIIVVVLGVVAFFARNTIARKSVEIGTKQMTGFPLEVGAVDLGVFNGTLEVRDLKLMNPPEFQGGTFVDLPLFRVDYDTMSMLSGAPHIKELVVNVNEVVIIKDEKGRSNATVLQEKVSGKSGDAEEPAQEEKKQAYRVDLVKIHVGTVVIKDYSSGKLKERKVTLNVDATYKDITESTNITALVMNTVFGQIGAVVGDVVKGLGDVVGGVGDAAKGATDTLQKTGKGVLDIFKKK